MAGRKKEGLDGIRDTIGGKRRDDRQAIGRTSLDPLTIDTKNVLTVMCMLQSPEDIVKLRAVASLELYGRKDPENLKLLSSLGIFEHIFSLIHHTDYIIRRFASKLIGMLSSIEECREQMLKKEEILKDFLNILNKDTDAVIQEYSSLTLSRLSSEYYAASELLKLENCVSTLFQRITTPDPDIQKNCLDIMNHLLNDVNGIEVFIESPKFDIKVLLNLTSSSYPVIQALAIEVLTQLTSWCRDTRVLIAFRDALGVEMILEILEKDEWADLQAGLLDLLMNVSDSPVLCEYLQQSGCLHRFICLLDSNVVTNIEKIIGVLARLSQTKRGREALYSVEIEKRFTDFLEISNDSILEQSCLGIANLAQNLLSLYRIVEAKPMNNLLEIIIDNDKNLSLRNIAAYALNILCNSNKDAARAVVENENYKKLFTVLTDNDNLPIELCQNVIQVFIGISIYNDLRTKIVSEDFLSALISCLPTENQGHSKDPCLQVDALECLSEYLIESDTRSLFHQLRGIDAVLNCIRSKFATVREWIGHLIAIASQCLDFVKDFIKNEGLHWMLKEKNTMYSMPSWQTAIEAIFANYLPAKFAYTGRLDLQDITQEGFYISTKPNVKFIVLDYFIEMLVSPVVPIYVANFNVLPTVSEESLTTPENSLVSSIEVPVLSTTGKSQKLKKFMRGAGRNSLEEYVWQGSLNTYPSVEYEEPQKSTMRSPPIGRPVPDPHLKEQLENLKKKMVKEDITFQDAGWSNIHPKIICNRARIIAEFVAEELSGPDPQFSCISQFKAAHINEMKATLGTNIFPLGFLRVGDYLERAMLFKVLADRIGFPCALVRGCYGRTWIEIAVPVINVEDWEESLNEKSPPPTAQSSRLSDASTKNIKFSSIFSGESIYTPSDLGEEEYWYPKLSVKSFKAFSSNYLKPNAIVDLVIRPGRILKMNSYEADEYCGTYQES